jgi:hypothetical protein
MNKEKLYKVVNSIYEAIENGDISDAKIQTEGLLNEIKYGIYD